MTDERSVERRWAPAALVLTAAVLVFANGLSSPFVFDDTFSILENPHLRVLWPPEVSLGGPPQSPVSGRPLVSLSLALNHAVTGLDPRGFRAVNLALHVLCALLVFGCVRRTLQRPAVAPAWAGAADDIALATALLFAVHPLATEVVNYVTQRTESLMALCYLATLYASLRAWDERGFGRWHVAAVVACALGMAAKEVMVTAPLMVALHDVCFAGRPARTVLRERRALYAGLAATWLVLAALNVSGPRSESVGLSSVSAGFEYALNQCVMVLRYVRLVIWPHPLILDYGTPRPIPLAQVLPAAAGLAALLGATLYALWRRPPLGFVGAWFFGILFPTSSFVPILTEVGADRRPYLSSAAALALVVALAWLGIARWRARSGAAPATARRAFHALVLVATLLLGALTVERNRDYQTRKALWESSLAAWPDNARGWTNLGLAVFERDPVTAERHFRRALEIAPDWVPALVHLGDTLRIQGRLDEAVAPLERALALQPGYAKAHNGLGTVLASQGRLDEAIVHFERATRAEPYSAAAHVNLGYARSLRDDPEGAIRSYELALALAPSAETHAKLANVLLRVGRRDEARRHLQEAARLKPEWPAPRGMLRRLDAGSGDAR